MIVGIRLIVAKVIATYGPQSYGLAEVGTTNEPAFNIVTHWNTCSLDGTTKAVCSISVATGNTDDSTTVSSVRTYTGSEVVYGQVAITAGALKLQNLAACTATSSGFASAATGMGQLYKVVVVPGAAALLAGAFV